MTLLTHICVILPRRIKYASLTLLVHILNRISRVKTNVWARDSVPFNQAMYHRWRTSYPCWILSLNVFTDDAKNSNQIAWRKLHLSCEKFIYLHGDMLPCFFKNHVQVLGHQQPQFWLQSYQSCYHDTFYHQWSRICFFWRDFLKMVEEMPQGNATTEDGYNIENTTLKGIIWAYESWSISWISFLTNRVHAACKPIMLYPVTTKSSYTVLKTTYTIKHKLMYHQRPLWVLVEEPVDNIT